MSATILIVDDDTAIQEVLAESLSSKGFRCLTASDGETALAVMDADTVDLLLTDIVMPGMGGYELIKKARTSNPRLQIVAMTGYEGSVTYDQVLNAGATDFIRKPFSTEELMARVKIVQMQEELRSLAITDELTGLYNRRGFFTLAGHLIKLARRKNTILYLLYADLDDLKIINDQHGHNAGDAALVQFAELLRSNFRESDVIARMGGDEFIVFPVCEDLDCINAIKKRLDELVHSLNERHKLGFSLSVSYGVACFDPRKPMTLPELVAHADQEMYRNKMSRKTSR